MPNKEVYGKKVTKEVEYSSTEDEPMVKSPRSHRTTKRVHTTVTKQIKTKNSKPSNYKTATNESEGSAVILRDMIEKKYKDYMDDIDKNIKKRQEMVPRSIYDEQHKKWTAEYEKLLRRIRKLENNLDDQNQEFIVLNSHCKHLEDKVKDLKTQKTEMRADISELDAENHNLKDEMEILRARLTNLGNEYDAMKLTKDKIIESLEIAMEEKLKDIESMKDKLIIWHQEVNELGKEYDIAINEFNKSNDALLNRNEKMKTKCQQLLKQQLDDMDERKRLLRQIQKLQEEKAALRKDRTLNKKTEIMHQYEKTEKIRQSMADSEDTPTLNSEEATQERDIIRKSEKRN